MKSCSAIYFIRRRFLDDDPVKNPNGGYTIGYVNDRDPANAARKAAEISVWTDVTAIAHDAGGRIERRPTLKALRRCMRAGDILLVATQQDISIRRSTCLRFMDDMEKNGLVVTILEWME